MTTRTECLIGPGGNLKCGKGCRCEAGLGFKAHPHMLGTPGFALANKGHDTRALQAYLGHRNIQHTVRYTELSPEGSRTFGDDVEQLADPGLISISYRCNMNAGRCPLWVNDGLAARGRRLYLSAVPRKRPNYCDAANDVKCQNCREQAQQIAAWTWLLVRFVP